MGNDGALYLAEAGIELVQGMHGAPTAIALARMLQGDPDFLIQRLTSTKIPVYE
jgi:hypothetical protein